MPNCIRITELVADSGDVVAIATQRLPYPAQRLGYSGLLQSLRSEPQAVIVYTGFTLGYRWSKPVYVPQSLVQSVYGINAGRPEPAADRNPEPAAEPLPVDCPASDYVSEFRELAVKFACRNVWKVQRQSAHVDAEDIAQDAVTLLLDNPQRYATEPLEAGASQAVNDAIRNAQGSELKRSVKFEPLAIDCGLSAPVETIPSDYETDADALSKLVGNALAIHAALMASGVEIETHSDACGISVRTVTRRRADVRNQLVAMALDAIV